MVTDNYYSNPVTDSGRKSIRPSLYRPFILRWLYFSKELNEMRYQLPALFKDDNILITISGTSISKPFSCFITDTPFSYDLLEKTQSLPLYQYNDSGRCDNISDWGLEQFRDHFQIKEIVKDDIFHYVYSVLHNPAYRKKYEINLKRDFPRIPFYDDFAQWCGWGKKLMDLHINYETAKPYPLKRTDVKCENNKAKLKADKEHGIIILDDKTTLSGVPSIAWEYKLGNRSALEWVLDQYKEKTPKDPTIREKFNTYRFADYKEHVIDLLMRVCTVSVETMKVVGEMDVK